jgi:hypothetical protein
MGVGVGIGVGVRIGGVGVAFELGLEDGRGGDVGVAVWANTSSGFSVIRIDTTKIRITNNEKLLLLLPILSLRDG